MIQMLKYSNNLQIGRLSDLLLFFYQSQQYYLSFQLYASLLQIQLFMDFFSAIVQNTEPKRRRRQATVSGVNNIFKTNMGAFLSFFQQTLKVAHRPTQKQNQQAIAANFKKINGIIDTIDEHINRRMNQYQSQIYSIVKGQIQQMNQQNLKLIEKLNKKIEQKDSEEQMFNIYNELDYFKSQALKLFNQCKKLRIEMKMLEKRNKEYDVQRENNNLCMQKLKRKYLREKALKNNLQNKNKCGLREQGFKRSLSKNQKQKRTKTMMEQIRQKTDTVQNQSVVQINLQDQRPVANKSASDSLEINMDQILDEKHFSQRAPANNLPALNFKKIESQVYFQDISLGVTGKKHSKRDQSVQTEEDQSFSNKKINAGIANHLINKRGFLQKSGFKSYQANQPTPYLDFNKMQMRVDRQQGGAFNKGMSETFTNNKLKFGISKDRYHVRQKTFNYS